MSKANIIRAWTDPQYRESLNPEEQARLPEHPAGLVQLTDEELKQASGLRGGPIPPGTTFPECTQSTLRRFRCCP
jgi:type 2 lantibiotic, mersacidin/lichenicidin family